MDVCVQDQNWHGKEFNALLGPLCIALEKFLFVKLPILLGESLDDSFNLLEFLRKSQFLEDSSQSHINDKVWKGEQWEEGKIDLLVQGFRSTKELTDIVFIQACLFIEEPGKLLDLVLTQVVWIRDPKALNHCDSLNLQ